jgi:hypothetical protein
VSGSARADCDEHLLAQLLALKSCQHMGCFPKLDENPDTVVDFVRRAVDLPEGTVPRAANRTAERQRTVVRQRTGLSYDKAKARKTAEAVMRSEAVSKNRPADLINIALEMDVEAGLELPGFTTLDALAAKVRTEVNASIYRAGYACHYKTAVRSPGQAGPPRREGAAMRSRLIDGSIHARSPSARHQQDLPAEHRGGPRGAMPTGLVWLGPGLGRAGAG